MVTQITISGTSIHQDVDGRYSLNDLHKAAVSTGVTKDIRPNEWMALDQTKGLTEILITENPSNKPIVSKTGRYGGTYVCRELVYAYANWISPAFYLKMIRAFDALVLGISSDLQQKTKPKTLSSGLTPAQQRHIQQRVAELAHLPGSNFAAVYRSIKDQFQVGTYKDISAEHYPDLCQFLQCLPLEGELLPKETPLSPVTKVNWPASRWLAESSPRVRDTMTLMQGASTLMVSPEMLFGPPDEFISPTLKAIAELERLGHNLEACRLEVLAMKHHLEGAHHLFEGVRLWSEQTKGRGVRFKIQS